MNGPGANQSWDLTSFVEAITAELDRARGLSRVKSEAGLPLTYLVRDLVLQLKVFPEYDGRRVTFRTAGADDEGQGASELKIELGSATAPVVEQTTKAPPKTDELRIDDLPLDQQTRDNLRNIGVESERDVQRLRNVKVRTPRGEVDFERLAMLMDRASAGPRRRPRIQQVVSFSRPGDGNRLRIVGDDLDSVSGDDVRYNGTPVQTSIAADHVDITLPEPEDEQDDVRGELVFRTLDGELLRITLEGTGPP